MALLEICAGSVESAIAARDGGAQRIELCAALEVGGVTPSAGLIAEARKVEGLILNVIIRPRGGDFLYNEYEVACMEEDIRTCKRLGADGVVIGALTAEGDIDSATCKRLIAATDGMSITFHRAFDMCRNPQKALDAAVPYAVTTGSWFSIYSYNTHPVDKTVYSGISAGKETLETKYIYSFSGDFLEELKNSRQEDMYTGVTSIGPHRDDIDFKINGISARKFGSQGQKRSVALAVKLAEAEVINKNVGEWPVILLDDVMSELDVTRQNYILNHIKGMQSFITCCDDQNVKGLQKGKKFVINNGCVL